jgi:crotonobetainyl-CoA:carnitine CoA-transferase CaiB-like acyl-CoA transferase
MGAALGRMVALYHARRTGEWQALCRVLGREDWLSDRRFTTNPARCRHDAKLDAAIAAETARFDGRRLMELLQDAGLAAGVVQLDDG